jgi:4-amino-4-deoxychorismate lyase
VVSPATGAASQTLVNGEVSPRVGVLDRGLAYGDGVFRTLRIEGGKPRWWQDHFRKLAADCRTLGIPCPALDVWERDLSRLVLPQAGVLRLTVTRGEGPRGYAPVATTPPTRIVTVWPWTPPDTLGMGWQVRVCHLRLGHQPALAGVKHLNRLENVLARGEWGDPAIREGILLDQEGLVVSGVTSNLFLWQHGRLRTPRLHRCGVAGVARDRLMDLAVRAGYGVEETEITLDDVHAADELMFTNSLVLLERAHRLEHRVWERPLVSPALKELLHA